MKFSKFIFIPVMIAGLAFTIQIVDQLLCGYVPPVGNGGFGWVAFQAWACYFVAGCNIEGGIKSICSYIAGCAASTAIIYLAGVFGSSLGFFATPVAVFLIVIPVICLERVKWFSFVPAIFVGAGAFFGFMTYVPGATFAIATTSIMIYCVVGVIYGWMTVTLRTAYEAKVNKN